MSTTEVIMAALAFGSLVVAVLAARRNARGDTRAAAMSDEQTRGDLRYLCRGVDEIRTDVRMMRDKLSDVDRRVTVVEESAKSAHKRIDEIVRGHPPDAGAGASA